MLVTLRGILPLYIRYSANTTFWNSNAEKAFLICEFMFNYTVIWSNYIFVFFGFMDFARRSVMMTALGTMITPYKLNIEEKFRILPTVNCLC